jgi:hypothetical protein
MKKDDDVIVEEENVAEVIENEDE